MIVRRTSVKIIRTVLCCSFLTVCTLSLSLYVVNIAVIVTAKCTRLRFDRTDFSASLDFSRLFVYWHSYAVCLVTVCRPNVLNFFEFFGSFWCRFLNAKRSSSWMAKSAGWVFGWLFFSPNDISGLRGPKNVKFGTKVASSTRIDLDFWKRFLIAAKFAKDRPHKIGPTYRFY